MASQTVRRPSRACALLALPLVVLALALPERAAAMGSPRTAAIQIALSSKSLYDGTIDGIRGPATVRGIRILQRRAGLVPPLLGRRVIRQGLVGWDVSQLQFMLAWHGFPSGTMDGAFGARTDSAVRRFQRFARLGVDGIVGAGTLRALRSPLPRSPLGMSRPSTAPITDRFGPRGARFHTGIDFPASAGARVSAARSGRVALAGWDPGGYGYRVVISHGSGVWTWYAHLSRIDVRRGQRVARGARIGAVGSTGFSTGPHLHFEVRVRGAATDPLTALR